MKITKTLLSLLLLILLNSCENIELVDNYIPYEETIVLRGELVSGEIFKGITLSRTLPLNEIYSEKKSEIVDAQVELTVNHSETISLNYFERGVYKSENPFIVTEGFVYEITVTWINKKIYAVTKIPGKPQFQSVKIVDNYIEGELIAKTGEVYGATWVLADSPESIRAEAEDFYDIVKGNEENNIGITIRTEELPSNIRIPADKNLLYIRFYAFDRDFMDYFYTQEFHNPTGNGFLQGGGPIIWNVEGDGIGMFIGVSKTKPIKSQ